MSRFFKILNTFIVLLVVLLIAGGLYLKKTIDSSLPQRSGQLSLAGLRHPVEVTFDKHAVPHVSCKKEADCAHALGYLHAQDRLFQMEMLRRVGSGRLSEIFGKKTLETDRFFRTLGLEGVAKEQLKKLKKEYKANNFFHAYIDGVNAFIAKNKAPAEFLVLNIPLTKFKAEDPYIIAGFMAYQFTKSLKTDPGLNWIKEHFPDTLYQDILRVDQSHASSYFSPANQELSLLSSLDESLRGIPQFQGSNAWVVSGSLTESGKPMLANDPHIPFSAPSVWYEAHLQSPNWEIYGHYMAGIPVALLGHNQKMSWGVTMLENLDMLLFEEKLAEDDSSKVWTKNGYQKIEEHQEIIQVKGEKPHTLVIEKTPRGPLMNSVLSNVKSETPISLWWVFLELSHDPLLALHDLAHSTSVQEAEDAASRINAPGVNILYATQKGDIAWWACSKILDLTAEQVAKGFISSEVELKFKPFSANPHLINPEEGFIVSANQMPDKDLPGYYAHDDRYLRIQKLLRDAPKPLSIEDMKRIQRDVLNPKDAEYTQAILSVLSSAEGLREDEKEALNELKQWRGEHLEKSIAPSIYHELRGQLIQEVLKGRLNEAHINDLSGTHFIQKFFAFLITHPESHFWQRQNENAQHSIILNAFRQTIAQLRSRLGPKISTWHWGKENTLTHKHTLGKIPPLNYIFDVGPFAVAGGSSTVDCFYSSLTPGPREVVSGPSTRRIIDMSNTKWSLGINPLGQSGHRFDHYSQDQVNLFLKREYRKELLDMEMVKAEKIGVLSIRPS